MNVAIIKRQRKDGTLSLYLDYRWPGGRKKEKMGIYIPARPRSAAEKDLVAEAERIAERRRSEAYTELLRGVIPGESSSATVAEYAMTICKTKKKPNTSNSWLLLHRHLVMSNVSKVKLSQLTVAHCVKFRGYLLSSSILAQSSASLVFSLFKGLLKQAYFEDLIPSDFRGKFDGIKTPESKIEYLDQHELDQLLSTTCQLSVVRRAFGASCLTGLRYSDIVALHWKNVIDVRAGGCELRYTQIKTSKPHILPIGPAARAWLGKRGTGLVFPEMPGQQKTNLIIKRWVSAAGIEKRVTFHVARHTFATLALAGGVDLKTVSEMLCHASISQTEVYAKVMAATLRHHAGAVSTAISPEISSLRLVKCE
jgi:site-specific recombinase XerD